MSIRADGTFVRPQPIGGCAERQQSFVSGDKLMINFYQPSGGRVLWHYSNARVWNTNWM
jgi:hypothetical protein